MDEIYMQIPTIRSVRENTRRKTNITDGISNYLPTDLVLLYSISMRHARSPNFSVYLLVRRYSLAHTVGWAKYPFAHVKLSTSHFADQLLHRFVS